MVVLCQEPDWDKTILQYDDIKEYLNSVNWFPEFFFAANNNQVILDQRNPRYAAELACAVAAWLATSDLDADQSPKAALIKWIDQNANNYTRSDMNDKISHEGRKRIAVVSNWDKDGGARTTPRPLK
jgi:hypothetical protein